MADKTPIRGAYNGSSLTGLAEYATGDTVGIAFGGTGLATVGSNQLLTGNGTSALTSESNLTYDGTTLATTAFTATGNVSLDGGTFVFNESGADYDFRVEGDGDAYLFFTDAGNDRVGIGIPSGAAPGGKLEIDQSSTTGAIPCLELDQADTDQPFIKFDGDSQSDTSGNITTDTSIGALTGYIRIDVEGTARWIAFYATSQELKCH